MLSDRRTREKTREAQRRARGPQVAETGEPGQMNRFIFDVSQLDGDHGLDGGGAFRFDHSKLDHLDKLRGGERPPPGKWRFDHSRLDGEDVLQ